MASVREQLGLPAPKMAQPGELQLSAASAATVSTPKAKAKAAPTTKRPRAAAAKAGAKKARNAPEVCIDVDSDSPPKVLPQDDTRSAGAASDVNVREFNEDNYQALIDAPFDDSIKEQLGDMFADASMPKIMIPTGPPTKVAQKQVDHILAADIKDVPSMQANANLLRSLDQGLTTESRGQGQKRQQEKLPEEIELEEVNKNGVMARDKWGATLREDSHCDLR